MSRNVEKCTIRSLREKKANITYIGVVKKNMVVTFRIQKTNNGKNSADNDVTFEKQQTIKIPEGDVFETT